MAMSGLKQKLLLFELTKLGFTQAAYDHVSGRVALRPGQPDSVMIADNGEIFYSLRDRDLTRDTLRPAVATVNEAAAAWENARSLADMELPEFRVMAEYNDTVLAARDDTGLGYGLHYVTWEYTYGRTGMHCGHYTEDYASAKEDFAVRSGLIRETKLLSQEQAETVRAAVAYRLGHDYDILPAAEDALKAVASKLERACHGPVAGGFVMTEQAVAEQEMADEPEITLGM